MWKYQSDIHVRVSKNCIDLNFFRKWLKDRAETSFPVSRRRNGAHGNKPQDGVHG